MAEENRLQFWSGPEANRLSVTPRAATPLWVTDAKKLYIGDGATPGGVPVHPREWITAGTSAPDDANGQDGDFYYKYPVDKIATWTVVCGAASRNIGYSWGDRRPGHLGADSYGTLAPGSLDVSEGLILNAIYSTPRIGSVRIYLDIDKDTPGIIAPDAYINGIKLGAMGHFEVHPPIDWMGSQKVADGSYSGASGSVGKLLEPMFAVGKQVTIRVIIPSTTKGFETHLKQKGHWGEYDPWLLDGSVGLKHLPNDSTIANGMLWMKSIGTAGAFPGKQELYYKDSYGSSHLVAFV